MNVCILKATLKHNLDVG